MQGIYTYIPETNNVPKQYSVSGILQLLFMVPISLVPTLALLYFYVSTFQSMCVLPNMAIFYSSFTSWFSGMLLMYFLNDFEMVPVPPIITGITLVFTFYVVYLVSFGTEFFALVRSVVTTPAARGIIPKVSWDSALKSSFMCASCVTQL